MSEARLLDAIEDAQEECERQQRWLAWVTPPFVLGVVVFLGAPVLLSFLHSAGVDWGWGSMLIPVVGAIVAAVFGTWTSDAYLSELPKARRKLKQAQRAHRDALMRGDM